jgi:hypothetical protein
MEALQEKLDDAESKKEHAETQFQKLMERVNTIKSQLGERLKEDAVSSIIFNYRAPQLMPYRRNCPKHGRKLRISKMRTTV